MCGIGSRGLQSLGEDRDQEAEQGREPDYRSALDIGLRQHGLCDHGEHGAGREPLDEGECVRPGVGEELAPDRGTETSDQHQSGPHAEHPTEGDPLSAHADGAGQGLRIIGQEQADDQRDADGRVDHASADDQRFGNAVEGDAEKDGDRGAAPVGGIAGPGAGDRQGLTGLEALQRVTAPASRLVGVEVLAFGQIVSGLAAPEKGADPLGKDGRAEQKVIQVPAAQLPNRSRLHSHRGHRVFGSGNQSQAPECVVLPQYRGLAMTRAGIDETHPALLDEIDAIGRLALVEECLAAAVDAVDEVLAKLLLLFRWQALEESEAAEVRYPVAKRLPVALYGPHRRDAPGSE